MKEQIKACLEALNQNENDRETFNRLVGLLTQAHGWKDLVRLYEMYPHMADWPGLVVSLKNAGDTEENVEKKSAYYHLMGQLLEFKLGLANEALKCFRQAVKVWPGRTESFDAARRLYLKCDNIHMVVKLIEMELNKGVSDARRSELYAQLSKICRVKLNNEEKADEYAEMARKFAESAKTASAEEVASPEKCEAACEAESHSEVKEEAEEKAPETEVSEEKSVEAETSEENAAEAESTEESTVEAETTEESTVEAETVEEKSVEAETSEESTVEAETSEEKTVEAETTEESTVEAETVEENAAEAETVEENAAEAETVEEKSVEAETSEESTVEAETSEENAAEAETVEEKTVEAETVEEKSEETEIVEESTVEAETSEESTVEAETVEEKSEETEIVEESTVEAETSEEKTVEAETTEESTVEAESTEEKTVEAETSEEKTVEAETVEENATKAVEDVYDSFEACCDAVYRLGEMDSTGIEDVAMQAISRVDNMSQAAPLFEALEEISAFEVLDTVLADLSNRVADEPEKRLLKADRADVMDLHLSKRDEAIELASPIAEGEDRAAFKAQAVLAGTDHEQLAKIAAQMSDLLKKLRRTPDEMPFMGDLADLYVNRMNLTKEAEEQYKRIKLAEPKNTKMLRFYCKYYEEAGDWQRVLSSLQTLKGAVAGTYRELGVARQIARVSEEKLNNPGKAVNVWNQLLKDGLFVDVAREELIGLYIRTQKWQALLEIYKNDLEALKPEQTAERIAVIKKCIEINDKQLHLDAMVIKLYHQILTIDPDNDEAVNALVERYEASKRWNDLLKILNQKAERTTDKEASIQIYYRIANLWSQSLGNVAKSVDPLLKVIELDPTQRNALRQLHDFYEQRNSWANLYDIIDKEAEVAEFAEKVSLLKRQAEIGESNLHSTEKAIESWEKLSKCLEDPSEALEELVRLYKKQGNYEALLGVYQRAFEFAHSESERVDDLNAIAQIYLTKLDNREKGIETLTGLLAIEEGREDALSQLTQIRVEAKEWDEVVALYVSLGRAEQVYELLDLAAGDEEDDKAKIELYNRMAGIAQEELHSDELAISAYEKILDVDATHEETAKRLLKYYREHGNHEKAIEAIQIIIAWTSDLEEKIAMHVEIAQLYENELHDTNRAACWYAKVVSLAPNRKALREHFEALAEADEASQLIYDVYGALLNSASCDAESRVDIHRVYARVCQNKLDKADEATKAWEVCLQANAEDREALDALECLYEKSEEYSKLLDIFDKKLALTTDPEEIKGLAFKRAQLLVTQLNDLEQAEVSYERVLSIDENNIDAIRGLKAIYDVTENWGKLAKILEKEREIAVEDRLDVSFELAEIERQHLEDLESALALYASILDEDPSHSRTISVLEQLVNDGVQPARIALILEPVYEKAGDTVKRCKALEISQQSLSDSDKLPVLWQIFDLQNETLQDLNAAFDTAVRIFKITPEDERVWEHLDKIVSTVDEASVWETLSELYATVVCDEAHREDWRYRLLFKRAMIVEEKLGKDKESIVLWEQYRTENEGDAVAIAHLEKLYRDNSEFEKLVKLYEFESMLSEHSDDERIAIQLNAAQIYEDILENSSEAIRIYRAVLDIDSSRQEALDALERLYRSSSLWTELANLYEVELTIYGEADVLDGIRCKLAKVCENETHDYECAVECYRSVLGNGANSQALTAASDLLRHLATIEDEKAIEYRASLCELLEPIFMEEGNQSMLIDVLRIKLADATDSYDKVELNRRIAGILKNDLSDDNGAFDAIREALKIDISDESLREDFEMLAFKLDKARDIIDLYEKEIEAIDDDALKHDLYKKVAFVYEEKLDDAEDAIKAYRKMIELDDLDAESLNALERLYTDAQNWEQLIDILNRKTEIGSDDEKVDILRKMATINCEYLGKLDAAIENYVEILNHLPNDRDSIQALESLYERTENWEALSDNYGIKLQNAESDEERRSILRMMAKIQEEKIGKKDEAIDYYRQILDIFPQDEETLEALDRLYLSEENYDDLVNILQKKLELHADDESTDVIEYRMGQVYQHKLDSISQAIELYKAILERHPLHEGANAAMKELLENDDYKLEASKVLERVYEKTEQYESLVLVLEIQLEEEYDPKNQVQLLVRIATIHQDCMSNYEAAFKDLARIIKIDQDSEFVERIEGLCEILDNTSQLVEVYIDVVGGIYEADKQVEFNNKIADLLKNRLDDESRAEGFYKATLEVSSDNAHALQSLDEIYTKREAWTDLLSVLEAKLQATQDTEAQMEILYRTADIQESKCEAHDEAIATYQRILELDKRQAQAIAQLSGIYERQNMWAEYVELIRSRIEQAQETSEILDLKYQLACIQYEKLGDNFDAIQTLKEILDMQSDNEAARLYLENRFEEGKDIIEIADILEPIYKAGNEWHKLIHSLEKRVENEDDVFTKVQILEQIAKTYRYSLSDESKALDTYGRMFELQPSDRDIQAHVEMLAAKTLELDKWFDLYDKALVENRIDDDSDKRVVMLSLAHLSAERLGKHEKARELCRALIEMDPEDMDAYDLLEWSYAQEKRYSELLAVWTKKVEVIQEQEPKIALLMHIASVQEEILHDDRAASETYQSILDIDPNVGVVPASVERLLRKTSQFEALSDFYRQRSDYAQNDETRVEYLHKLGVVLARELHRVADATEVLGDALSIDKNSTACKRAVETMLNETEATEENAEIRHSMACLLEPLYTEEDWSKLARVINVLVETSDDIFTKVGLYMRLGALYESHDTHPQRAFDVYAKAFIALPNTENAREKLESIAERLDNYEQLADVYSQAIEATEDDNDKLSLYERVAVIRSEKLNQIQEAAACYEAVLGIDEFSLTAIVALEKLYALTKENEKRVAILKKHVEIASNLIDQKDLLYRIADIQENALDRIDDAIATYDEVLNLDPEDFVALDALERLYEQSEKWAELVDIYERKLNAGSGMSHAVEIYVKIAKTYREKLHNSDEAIQYYARAFEQDRDNGEVASALEELYSQTEQYDELLMVLESEVERAQNLGDLSMKHNRQIKMAHILIDNVKEDSRAIEVLRNVLSEDGENAEAIEILQKLLEKDDLVNDIAVILLPIYKQLQRDNDYMRLCERRIEVASDDYDRRNLYIEAANVADEVLNDADKAFGFIENALMLNPADDEIVSIAETIASRHEQYMRLTSLCEKVMDSSDDPDAIVKLSLLAAKYYEQQLTDIDKTIAQYERILRVDELNETALMNLHRLYRQTEQNDKLADVLTKLIDNGMQPINEYRFELVSLKLENAPEEALELLKQILWDEKDNENAFAALESLLSNKALVGDIAEILEPRYLQNGEHEKLATLLQAKIDVAQDPIDILTYTKQLAQIQAEKLSDEPSALKSYIRALEIDPSDPEVMSAVEQIAKNLGQWDELACAYRKVVEVSSDDSDKIAFQSKLARLYVEKLSRYEDAVVELKGILDIDAENMDALKLLESIYSTNGKTNELLDVKSKIADLTFEPDAQKAILFQCADLALNTLNLNERGVAFLEKIIEIDDSESNAIEPLLVLYNEVGAYDKYVDLLNKKLMIVQDDDSRFEIYISIAKTASEKLDDIAMAVDAYRDALNIRRTAEVYAALERIYATHEQYQDLDDLLISQLDDAEDSSKKAALYVKRAEIAEKHFNDDLAAIDLFKDALNADAMNADAFNGLDRIYSKNGEFQELYDLLKEQKESTSDENLVLLFNIRMAKLAATHLGDVEAAIVALNEVLKVQPNNLEALDSLIAIYEQQKSYDLALNCLQKKLSVVKSNTEKAEVYCYVARMIKKANWEVAQVEASYQAALQSDPDNEEALQELLAIAEAEGNTKKLLERMADKAKRQTTDEGKLEVLAQIVEIASAHVEFAKIAAQALQWMHDIKPDDIDISEKLVNSYIKADDFSSAKPILEGIIENLLATKQTKKLPPFYSLQGRMLKLSGDIEGARQAFEAANAIDKNNIANNLELGILLYETGDYEASLKIMQTLLLHQMNVKDKEVKTNIFYYLGMLRVKTNDPKRAKDMFNRALGVDPNHAPTKAALAELG